MEGSLFFLKLAPVISNFKNPDWLIYFQHNRHCEKAYIMMVMGICQRMSREQEKGYNFLAFKMR